MVADIRHMEYGRVHMRIWEKTSSPRGHQPSVSKKVGCKDILKLPLIWKLGEKETR